MPAFGLILFI